MTWCIRWVDYTDGTLGGLTTQMVLINDHCGATDVI